MIVLQSPLDMHVHLRTGDMLRLAAPYTARPFAGALVMPNIKWEDGRLGVTTEEDLISYHNTIVEATSTYRFEPYMTLFFDRRFTPEFIEKVRSKIVAIKFYPDGVTTNSRSGVSRLSDLSLEPIFSCMQGLGIPLCVHGESNGFVMDREKEFLLEYILLAKRFPSLKIIMEHITTSRAVDLLDHFDNLYATITVHHLFLTLDNVIGGLMSPHAFCKPIPKTDNDLYALRKVVLKGHPKVMLGTDSAPHDIKNKEAPSCCAGIFSAPTALPLLCELFDDTIALQRFVSDNARNIYKLSPLTKEVTLNRVNTPGTLSCTNGSHTIVHFGAGRIMKWAITGVK